VGERAVYHRRLHLDFPRYRGHAAASRRGLFEGFGTDAAQVAMTAGTIVEDLDVVEHVGASELAGLVDAVADAFLFQAAEERFSDRVDAPMSSRTRRFCQVCEDQRI